MTILSKVGNQIIMNRITLLSLALQIFEAFFYTNFVESECFFESNSPNILALWETNLDNQTDSGNFSVRGYLPLIRKDSSTHMYGLAVYVKEELPFARGLSLENSDSYLCLRMALLHSVCYFLSLYWSLSLYLRTVFYSISSNIDEVLSINSSVIVLVLGDFNVHHKVELIDLVNSVTVFLPQTSLLRWLTFLIGPQTVILMVLFFWIYLSLPTLIFVQQRLSLHWEILIMLLSQFPLTFHHSQRDARFTTELITILVLISLVFVIILKMFHGRISLKSVLRLLLMNFVSGLRLELMYVSLIETIRSSLNHLHGYQLLVLLP